MLSLFKPTWMVNNIYQISPEKLKSYGISAILTDLDNTLIPWNNPEGTVQLHEWLERIRDYGIRVIVVSNNNRERIEKALNSLQLPFVARALKPLTFGILRALKTYHLKRSQVVMVGDQILTDIWAANNTRIRSILVKPLVTSDAWNTRINRFFEAFVYTKLMRKYDDLKWKDDID
ncbi:YqeG family HAD IIIA-type phosphatase [Fructilactobacillus fructivorans]|uniref:Hydrolase, HAD subfamily IIIA n=2 Tax=Fructilactobacillus fructivorans TaxID=1614 RepID=A0A0C1M702_9LACO|nr:YqeG family HAD IIIA-type phosphatase [Fructilactobacillus fructivorans]KID42109.1 Hydrolase, HAD subfamily IIIA [Fructilactobacillus fructivorans]KRK58550.1 hydrolase [Fructilactobacillus fructivorans]KRN13395.1 hydrolase [Fructilactobacillus fructivorans]KRN40104.1 hydrolase [Fructilactobacillus fructivorans]MCT0152001.1 YqeG family HAD IIIA-type phosphatase [Fructilactobacillus fructivorans]